MKERNDLQESAAMDDGWDNDSMTLAVVQVTDVRAFPMDVRDIPRGIIGGRIRIEYADPLWDGLKKTVVFRSGRVTVDVLDPGETVPVPQEVLTKAGVRLYVGIYGTDAEDTVAIPTLWAYLGMVRDAADPSGDASSDPSLPVWAQIQALIGELDDLTARDKTSLVAAINEAAVMGGGTVDEETLREWMNRYLQENPLQMTETDPTVPAWAKAANKPSYSKAEVGLGNLDNEKQYSATNPPPYPVTSVNGKTGAVMLDAEAVGAQPAGTYLTEVPAGYATEEFVRNKIAEAELNDKEADLSGYAQKSELPTKVSQLANDAGYLTGYTETDPTVPAWAKAASKPSYSKADVGLGNVDNVKQYSVSNPPPYPVTSVNGKTGAVTLDTDVTADKVKTALGYEPLNPDDMFTVRQTAVPDYTNQIPLSVDTDGSVYNKTGLIAGKALNSTGALMDNADTYVTGYIPVKKGDIIRIKDTQFITQTYALYGTAMSTASGIGKTLSSSIIAEPQYYGTFTVTDGIGTWDTSGITYYLWNNFAYVRLTLWSAHAVVTVNEELVDVMQEQLILKPAVKVPADSLEVVLSNRPLSGKTVVCFGDSLFGMYRGEDSAPANIAKYTGATVHNVGFGGCRMSVHPTSGYGAFSMWALAKAVAEKDWTTQDAQASSGSAYFPEQLALLKSIDFNMVDMVVIHYGTNDFRAGGGIAIDNGSDHDDCNTMCGALRYSIEKLLGAYPKLQIYVSLPVYRFWTENDVTTYAEDYVWYEHKLTDVAEAFRGVAEEYHLPVIDGYNGMGINRYNASAYLSDGTHHNIDGRKLFGEFIGGHLIGRQTSAKSGMDTDAVNALISAAIGNAIGGSY